MRKISSLALCLFCCPSAFSQSPSVRGELHLDARTPLRVDFPYQRWDAIQTAEVRLDADFKNKTHIGVLAQRKYFSTKLVEAVVERPISPNVTARAGLQRLPFGLYDWQETYRSGLIDYPMPRSDYGTTGIDQAVLGVGATARSGRFQFDGAAFDGRGVTVWNQSTPYRGAAGRIQTYLPPGFLVGLSHVSEAQRDFAGTTLPVRMSGLDVRYSRPYLVMRGEALRGKVGGGWYAGEYLDTFYRLPGVPAITLTARAERLKPAPGVRAARQGTLGARWTIDPQWTFTANWRGNDIGTKYEGTWVPQSRKRGDVLCQLYYRIPLFR